MRMLLLTVAAAVVSAGAVMSAYTKKKQFYPSVVYLVNSSRSMSVSYGDCCTNLDFFKILKLF